MELRELQKYIGEWGERKGWKDKWNLFEKLCLAHTELSEAVEALRINADPTYLWIDNITEGDIVLQKPEGFGVELADLVIRILHICSYYNIPLQQLIEEKMLFNELRTHRHGGKLA